MPPRTQKKTIIFTLAIVACILVIFHIRQASDTHQVAASAQSVLNYVLRKKTVLTWPNQNPIPEVSTLKTLSIGELSHLYFSYVNTLQIFCPVKRVYGGVKNGFYTCDVVQDDFSHPCVSYMITSSDKEINNAFFDELKKDYQCERNVILNSAIKAAQDSSDFEKVYTVSALKSKVKVDYMAIDNGGNETKLLSWMLTNNLLEKVQQLLVRFHGIEFDSAATVYMEHLQVLRRLYAEGFRTFHFERSINCIFKTTPTVTGCYILYMMRQTSVKGPLKISPDNIGTAPINQLTSLYHSYLVSTQVHCKQVIRVGRVDDGGWDICNDTDYRPSAPCLVYSFGVAGDWSFDDQISNIYGCQVHSFDPSIGKADHQRSPLITFHNLGLWGKPKGMRGKWTMMNLKGIIDMLGHTGKTIDIVKMDIEASEWDAIPDMVATGVLKNVRQLYFEFHSQPNPAETMRMKVKALQGIEEQGFKLFWSHPNIKGGNPRPFSITGRQVSGCYENYYLNTNKSKH
ncbi:uncharacterized protein [Argopecten irradians]|uniref:uncharacterized protein n=1 Tax=Argopecten irradians TaxID=31199 RepID=UPI003713EED5